MVDGISWTQCAQVLEGLTVAERIGLKSVERGEAKSVNRECLDRLQALGLVGYNGREWSLTDNGRAIAQFC